MLSLQKIKTHNEVIIGIANSMVNETEVMISLLKHQFCLTSLVLTGPKSQKGIQLLALARSRSVCSA